MLRKRGQITIFIIIGILILFAFALFFYLRGVEVEKRAEIARPVVEKVPTELNPIVLYTEDCLKTVATDGLVLLGQHGGYIYPEEYGKFSFSEPTDADGLIFSEGSGMMVPYWFYNSNPNDANMIGLASMRPGLHRIRADDSSIESQLDRFIEKELPVCLANYSVFKEQGYRIEEAGEISVKSTVIPGAVTFLVDYPLDVALGETGVRRISQFFAAVDVDLNQIYEIASAITEAEEEFAFLEHRTLALLDVFSDTTTDKLPPITEATFDFVSTVFWTTQNVEENVRKMLMSYIPLFRFYGSKNFYQYRYRDGDYKNLKQRIYDNMILDFGRPTDLEVRFDYLDWWPIYLVINDNTGIIQPQSASISFFGFRFGMQRYYTVYDLSYPVLITLTDSDALDGKGYVFNFALEANIRDNSAVSKGQRLLPATSVFEESMLCNFNQRNSANYTIGVRDSYNGSFLEDVQISFSVGDESCVIGATASSFVGSFPVAYGGLLTLAKEGYLTTSSLFDPKPADEILPGEDILEFEMNRFDTINVSVKKKKIWKYVEGKKIGSRFPFASPDKRTGWFFEPAAYDLEPWEQAVVTLVRVSDFDEEYAVSFSVYGNESREIQLVPGRYNVNINLLLNEFVKIPSRTEEECVKRDIFGRCTKKEKITIPEINFDVLPNGGVDFSDDETCWILEGTNLYNSNKITFYAVSPAITDIPEEARVIEDLNVMNLVANYSKDNRQMLEPSFS